MRDHSGISLSNSNPDNLESPIVDLGVAEDAADYCQSADEYGDTVAGLLDASNDTGAASVPLSRLVNGPRRRRRQGGLLLLAGGVVLGFMLLMILSEG